jgi:hypothetical protein
MRTPFLLSAEKSLRFEIAKDREYGGVGETRGESVADFRDGAGAVCPEILHDVELSLAKSGSFHERS